MQSPERYGLHGWQYPAPRRIRPVVRALGTVASWLFLAVVVAVPWVVPYLMGPKS